MQSHFITVRIRKLAMFVMAMLAWTLLPGVAQAQTTQRSITPILMLLLENECSQTETFTVTGTAGSNGSISPATQAVFAGCTGSLTVTPDAGYGIDTVSGCSGFLNGNTYTTGSVVQDCTVTAAFLPAYQVSTSVGTGGTVTPGSVMVTQGKTTSLTVTPTTGYAIHSVSGCGGSLSGNTFTTGPITTACTVSATFDQVFTVTATAGTGGTIAPSGNTSVVKDQTQAFTVTANSGYVIGSVGGTCGGSLVGNTYTTNAITTDCTVTASFTPTFTVTTSAGTGGTIDPTSAVVVQNQTKQFTVTANSGYVVSSISGCGGTPPETMYSAGPYTYTTGAITAACTVTASFLPTFTLTATAGTGGTITPGSAVVAQTQTQAFTVTPNAGFAIKSVTGCGGTLSGNTYTTAPVTGACTVSATFQAVLTVTASVTGGVGGSVTPLVQAVASGTTAQLTLLPYTGYVIDGVHIVSTCGGSLSNNIFTTGPVTANCTVTVPFILESGAPTYEITTNAGANGSITPLGMTVRQYTTWSFTLVPDTGYMVDTASGCGGSLDTLTNEYTTGPITANCTVSATFRTSTPSYTVTASAGSNGTISPSSRTVTQGQTTTFTVTPSPGYTASMGGTCGGSLSGTTYTTNAITGNCTVTASFSINQSPTTDPGYKSNVLWLPPGSTDLVVADTSGTDSWPPVTYVPGCLNSLSAIHSSNGCALSTSYTATPAGLSSPYTATLMPGKTISIRLKANLPLLYIDSYVSILNDAGTIGLPGGGVSIWLTTNPTQSYEQTTSVCKAQASSSLLLRTTSNINSTSRCILTAGQNYYLNIRADCNACRLIVDGGSDDFQQ